MWRPTWTPDQPARLANASQPGGPVRPVHSQYVIIIRLTAVFAVDDAELSPAEMLQHVDVDSTELRRLRVNVEGEDVTGA